MLFFLSVALSRDFSLILWYITIQKGGYCTMEKIVDFSFETEKEKLLILKKHEELYSEACVWLSNYIYKSKSLYKKDILRLYFPSLLRKVNFKKNFAITVLDDVLLWFSRFSSSKEWILPKKSFFSCKYLFFTSEPNKQKIWIDTILGTIDIMLDVTHKINYFSRKWSISSFSIHFSSNTVNQNFIRFVFNNKPHVTTSISNINNIVGIDCGVKYLITTNDSDGNTFFYSGGKLFNKLVAFERDIIKNPESKKAQELLDEEISFATEYLSAVAISLCEKYRPGTLFCFEFFSDSMTEYIGDASPNSFFWVFQLLKKEISELAPHYNHLVIDVERDFTSQTCPRCGNVSKSHRKKEIAKFICGNCHFTSNDDEVAAINIKNKGLRYIMDTLQK